MVGCIEYNENKTSNSDTALLLLLMSEAVFEEEEETVDFYGCYAAIKFNAAL